VSSRSIRELPSIGPYVIVNRAGEGERPGDHAHPLEIAAGTNAEIQAFLHVILLADAAGLDPYAVVGAQKSINLGLTVYAAALIGIINATGGGMLRDVLSREDPAIFKPGQLYAVVACAGVIVFLALGVGFKTPAWVAAVVYIAVTFVLRVVTVHFDIRTHPVHQHAIRTIMTSGLKTTGRRLRRAKYAGDNLPSDADDEVPGKGEADL